MADGKLKLRSTGIAGAVCLGLGLITLSINARLNITATALLVLGLVGLFVFGALNPAAVKGLVSSRGTRYKGGTSVLTVLVVIILGLVNFLASRHNYRLDLTAAGTYSLSPQTINVLKGLDKDIRILAFVQDGQKSIVEDLMTEYRYYSTHISAEYYDINEQPALAGRYGITADGTIIVEYDIRTEKIEELPTEELLTNAILKVTRAGSKTVYFVTGHGEKDLELEGEAGYTGVKQELEAANYTVRTVSLLQEGRVPADCDVLVLAGPQQQLVATEIAAVAAYLDNGGAALVLVDPEQPGLAALVAPWRVTVGDDIIVDVNPNSRFSVGSEFMPIIQKYEPHRITRGFRAASILPLVRSVSVAKAPVEGVTAVPLMRTSAQSWADSEPGNESVRFDEKSDTKGPVSMAVAVESKRSARKDADEIGADAVPGDPVTRLVVVGDSDFGANTYLKFPGNLDLFMNMVGWLAAEDDLVTIRPKDTQDRQVFLTLRQSRIVFWLVVVIWPLAVILAGIWVWINRRK